MQSHGFFLKARGTFRISKLSFCIKQTVELNPPTLMWSLTTCAGQPSCRALQWCYTSWQRMKHCSVTCNSLNLLPTIALQTQCSSLIPTDTGKRQQPAAIEWPRAEWLLQQHICSASSASAPAHRCKAECCRHVQDALVTLATRKQRFGKQGNTSAPWRVESW